MNRPEGRGSVGPTCSSGTATVACDTVQATTRAGNPVDPQDGCSMQHPSVKPRTVPPPCSSYGHDRLAIRPSRRTGATAHRKTNHGRRNTRAHAPAGRLIVAFYRRRACEKTKTTAARRVPGRARAFVSVVGRSRRRVDRSFASTLMPFLSSDSRPVFPLSVDPVHGAEEESALNFTEVFTSRALLLRLLPAAPRQPPGPVEVEPARLDRSVHLRVRLRAHFQLPGGLVSRLLFRLFAVLPPSLGSIISCVLSRPACMNAISIHGQRGV